MQGEIPRPRSVPRHGCGIRIVVMLFVGAAAVRCPGYCAGKSPRSTARPAAMPGIPAFVPRLRDGSRGMRGIPMLLPGNLALRGGGGGYYGGDSTESSDEADSDDRDAAEAEIAKSRLGLRSQHAIDRHVRDERLVRHQRREARLVLAICEGISASSREDLELKVGWAPLREEVEDAERDRLRATFNGTSDVQRHENIPQKAWVETILDLMPMATEGTLRKHLNLTEQTERELEVALKAFKRGYASPVHPSSVVDRAVQHYGDKIRVFEGEIAKLEATLSAEEENRQVAAANGWVRGREMDGDKSSSLRKQNALDRRLRMLPGVDCLSNFSKTEVLSLAVKMFHVGLDPVQTLMMVAGKGGHDGKLLRLSLEQEASLSRFYSMSDAKQMWLVDATSMLSTEALLEVYRGKLRCLKPMLERLEERKRKGNKTAKALKLKRTMARLPVQLTFSSIRREGLAKSAGRMFNSSRISYRSGGQPARSDWMRVLAAHHGVSLVVPSYAPYATASYKGSKPVPCHVINCSFCLSFPDIGQTQVNPIMPDKEKRLDVLSLERLLKIRRQAYNGMSLDRVISRDLTAQLNEFVPVAHSRLSEDIAVRKGALRCTETKKEGGGKGARQHQWLPVYEMLLMGEDSNGGSPKVVRRFQSTDLTNDVELRRAVAKASSKSVQEVMSVFGGKVENTEDEAAAGGATVEVPADDDLERLLKLREAFKAEGLGPNGVDEPRAGVQGGNGRERVKRGGGKRRRDAGEVELKESRRGFLQSQSSVEYDTADQVGASSPIWSGGANHSKAEKDQWLRIAWKLREIRGVGNMTGRLLRIPKGVHVDRKCSDCGKRWPRKLGFADGMQADAAALLKSKEDGNATRPGVGGERPQRMKKRGGEQKKTGGNSVGKSSKKIADPVDDLVDSGLESGLLAAELDLSVSD